MFLRNYLNKNSLLTEFNFIHSLKVVRLIGIQILVDNTLSKLTYLFLIESQIDLLPGSETKSSTLQN